MRGRVSFEGLGLACSDWGAGTGRRPARSNLSDAELLDSYSATRIRAAIVVLQPEVLAGIGRLERAGCDFSALPGVREHPPPDAVGGLPFGADAGRPVAGSPAGAQLSGLV